MAAFFLWEPELKIHREGYPFIAIFVAINLLAFLLAAWLGWLLIPVTIWCIAFFRDPDRNTPEEAGLIICPADGKVVVIEEMFDTEYFNSKRLQVSIFMSPANVHVNRNPISGQVVYNKYHKGKYLVAWNPKSSTENERHSVVIRHSTSDILVKQIAGALAKRIKNYLEVGQQVQQNNELGFIRFGSRVDVLLPVGTTVNVQLNQVVKGGVTVLATLKP